MKFFFNFQVIIIKHQGHYLRCVTHNRIFGEIAHSNHHNNASEEKRGNDQERYVTD